MDKNNYTSFGKAALVGLLISLYGLFGCSKKSSPTASNADPVKVPSITKFEINGNAKYALDPYLTIKLLEFENINSVQAHGDVQKDGYQPVGPDSTIDAVATTTQGQKKIGITGQNADGVTDTIWHPSGIILDSDPPQSLDSIDTLIDSYNDKYNFNIDLNDTDSGSYVITGATTASGDIRDLDNVVYNEGINNIKITAFDEAGNPVEKDIVMNTKKVGLDYALDVLDSLGYEANDSTPEPIVLRDSSDNEVQLQVDKMISKTNVDKIWVLYDENKTISAQALEAINRFNDIMESRNQAKRIIYIDGPKWANDMSVQMGNEIGIYESQLPTRN